MRKILFLLSFSVILFSCSPTKKFQEAAKSWEPEIQKLEQLDKTETDPKDAILFIGSSSIRLWNNIRQDMAPYPVIQRGYGGAKFSDLLVYTKRLVYPHQFKAVAIFVANDITGSEEDKTPEEVLDMFKSTVKIIRKKDRKAPVYFIAITPTELRWNVWPQAKKANSLISAYCASHKNLHFIDTETRYLGGDGRPIGEYFIGDKLHQTQKGYDVWASIIKETFDKTLKSM
ncbi:MAG: hypothetical protein IPP61_03110 [Cytophagaceae bacterium]|nr:hypothetical protein [Cytophagaceae bacterium]MBL0301344.1 hypothetical protein [Cytophagaceae bacterium]MBL0324163.1 hypothetical protein [Cytophagaceae bacterium]